ncbi:hypothetical protein ACOSQ4_031676 [Xanthoceras sorbifolium]
MEDRPHRSHARGNSKWAEAEPLVPITEQNITDFVKKSIIYRFGVPDTIISDNSTQLDNLNFPDFCRRVETVIPIEMRIQSPRVAMYDPVHNIFALETSLDELKSLRNRAQIRNAMYQQRVGRPAGHGFYKIARLEGEVINHPWNVQYLKIYFP